MGAVGEIALGELIGQVCPYRLAPSLWIVETGQQPIEKLVPTEIGAEVRIVLGVPVDPPAAPHDVRTVIVE